MRKATAAQQRLCWTFVLQVKSQEEPVLVVCILSSYTVTTCLFSFLNLQFIYSNTFLGNCFSNYRKRNLIFFNEHIIKLSAINLFAVAANFLCLVTIIADPLSKSLSMINFVIL